MRAAIRITRVGIGIVESRLQPGSQISQRVQLEAVDLSFVSIDCECGETGIYNPLRVSNSFLVHVGVNPNRETG